MKLELKTRDLVGKKVKRLRKESLIPASIYGPERESTNVVLSNKKFKDAFNKAGYNKLIDVEIEGDEGKFKALIKDVQMNYVTDEVIHVSLYQVDMKKPIVAEIPVETTGVSPAVKNNIGFLVTPINSLTVHCLPKDLPSEFVIDISTLTQVGDNINVESVQLPEGVEWDSSVDVYAALAYIAPPQKIIVEEETTEEAEEGEEGEKKEGEEGDKEETKEEEK